MSNEREEIREKIAKILTRGTGMDYRDPELGFLEDADEILALEGIRIESDDQSLPTYNGKPFMEGEKARFFIKALNKAGWVKCLPKGDK